MIKKLFNVITGIVLITALLVAGLLILPRAFGQQSYAVISGSMEPAIHVGSIAVVKPVTADKIKIGDTITFVMTDADAIVATHRVIAIDSQKQQFTTKGDANETQDISPVSFDRLIGKCIYSVPLLGYVSLFVQTSRGKSIAILSLLAIVLLMLIPELFKKEPDKNRLGCNSIQNK